MGAPSCTRSSLLRSLLRSSFSTLSSSLFLLCSTRDSEINHSSLNRLSELFVIRMRDPNLELQESGWEELRKEARKIEGDLDVKLSSYAKLGARFTQGGSGSGYVDSGSPPIGSSRSWKSMEMEIQSLLEKLLDINDSMSRCAASAGPATSVTQKLARHRDILHEFTQEFRRIKGNINSMREHAELLSSVRDDITDFKTSGSMSPRMQLLRERAAIHGSISHEAIAKLTSNQLNITATQTHMTTKLDGLLQKMAILETNQHSPSSSSANPHSPPPSSHPHRMKLDVLRFDGTDPSSWIFKITQLTLAWFQWMTRDGLISSWPGLLQALEARFVPSQYEDPIGTLFKLTQREIAELADPYSWRRNMLSAACPQPSCCAIDDVISQAQATRVVLGSQRTLFTDVQGKVKVLGDKFPMIRSLLGSIRRRRSRDTLILSAVIAACTFNYFVTQIMNYERGKSRIFFFQSTVEASYLYILLVSEIFFFWEKGGN
ncbi:Golgi SNAP receptor complex member 1-2 [Glycine soja]